MLSRLAMLVALLAALGCSAKSNKSKETDPPKGRSFTLFATTELRGNIEPCGCTSDPMGDLSRTVEMIEKARKGSSAVLYVDGGSTLYSELSIPEHLEAQEKMKSELLFDTLTGRLGVEAVGLGPYDVARGLDAVRPARHALNVVRADNGKALELEAPEITERGGVKIGLFGVVSPAALPSTPGLIFDEPAESANSAAENLRERGAEVVIGLAHMTMQEARALAKATDGIDVLLVGQKAPRDPTKIARAPTKVGTTWLIQPADRGQVVTRMDITMRGEGPLADALGSERAEQTIATIDERIARLQQQLAEWEKAPDADPAFLKTKKDELEELGAERKALENDPLRVPDDGPWFVMSQVEIRKALPCDEKVQAEKVALDKAVGTANVQAAKGTEPPEPEEGQAGYSGIEECGFCHSEAVEFWRETKHAGAWETLEKYGKQFSYDCIYCHVTGWKEPGGSNLAVNEHLRDVQCEICHGPGSLHVDSDGEALDSLVLAPPEDRCVTCHNELHSDTFDYEPYLRNITGEGHGAEFREKLGDGPTGHELREAALEKAGAAIGEGCLK